MRRQTSTIGRSHPRGRGFTLVELSVVVAVVAILMGIVAPSFIEMSKNRLVDRAARQITILADASRAMYHESYAATPEAPTENAVWPGEEAPPACKETGLLGAEDALREFLHAGTANLPPNPWGKAYEIELDKISSHMCLLEISTVIPADVKEMFQRRVQNTTCDKFCSGTPAAAPWARCCARIPRPGFEPALEAMSKDGLRAKAGTSCGWHYEEEASGSPTIVECQGMDPRDECPDGYHQVGDDHFQSDAAANSQQTKLYFCVREEDEDD